MSKVVEAMDHWSSTEHHGCQSVHGYRFPRTTNGNTNVTRSLIRDCHTVHNAQCFLPPPDTAQTTLKPI
eukprot:800141-Amphidinium_carterae.1